MRGYFLRLGKYFRRHGFTSTLIRIRREITDRIFFHREFLYWRDLMDGEIGSGALPDGLRIERYDRMDEVPEKLLVRIFEYYPEELQRDTIKKRFEIAGRLWCLFKETEAIGYLWSIEGRTMKPYYYFPLLKHDVHLDDGFIFPEHRGKGLFSVLNNHIFQHYKSQGFRSIYQEIAEWNAASMNSAIKHGFNKIGLARIRYHHGRCKVTWWR